MIESLLKSKSEPGFSRFPYLDRLRRAGRGQHRRSFAAEALWAVGAMALSPVIAALVLELWHADLSVPLFRNYSDETTAHQ